MTTEPAKAHGNAAAATRRISTPPTGEEAQISLDSIAGGGSSITTASGRSGNTTSAVAENTCNDRSSNNNGTSLILRHGSSLRLIATVCSFLADPGHSDNFSYIDPNGDQGKWKRKGMDLYYCAVMDPTTNNVLCAARCATQGLLLSSDDQDGEGGAVINVSANTRNAGKAAVNAGKKRRRLLIDYLYTIESARDKGIARQVISFILQRAQEAGAYSYVLSLEESAVYWMEKWGFYLCEDPKLNRRLNVFPDTHLLRLGTDPRDEILPEEAANYIYQQQRERTHEDGENTSPNGGSGTTDGVTTGNVGGNGSDNGTPAVPPKVFTSTLAKLLALDPPNAPSDGLKLCLNSLSFLIRNAMTEESGGRRRRIRIANPNVRQRVFAVGGDHAMNLLQCAGFELGVDEEGDATLTFHDGANQWLTAAVELLEQKAA